MISLNTICTLNTGVVFVVKNSYLMFLFIYMIFTIYVRYKTFLDVFLVRFDTDNLIRKTNHILFDT